MNELEKIVEIIRNKRSFFLGAHTHPDGDTLGSQLALASFLKRKGKRVGLGSHDPVPPLYQFLPHWQWITPLEKIRGRFDVGIILECSQVERMGGLNSSGRRLNLKRLVETTVNIDHHLHSSCWADLNLVDSRSSSTAEMVYGLLKRIDEKITPSEALCLYVGVLTDTGGFQRANTNPQTHLLTAELLGKGIKVSEVSQHIYGNRTLSGLRLLGRVLSGLKLVDRGRIAFMEITNLLYRRTRTSVEDMEGFIDYAVMIKGVKVAVLLRETEQPGRVKVSLRSQDKIAVNRIAEKFGGGGHLRAAGCQIGGGLKEARRKILKEIKKWTGCY